MDRTSANTIQVSAVDVTGYFDDLYDFAYGGGDKAKEASMVQSGHASLASPPEEDSGKIFFTRLVFATPLVNTWDGPY